MYPMIRGRVWAHARLRVARRGTRTLYCRGGCRVTRQSVVRTKELVFVRAMSLSGERIRLLSLVDVFEPLSAYEIACLDERLPDAHLKTGGFFFTPAAPTEKVF